MQPFSALFRKGPFRPFVPDFSLRLLETPLESTAGPGALSKGITDGMLPKLPPTNPYYQAKKAELSRDLPSAEYFYREAQKQNHKPDSAIKDLAMVIHQQGRTQEACELLIAYRPSYQGDLIKYDNLLASFQQQSPSKRIFRSLVIFNVPRHFTEKDIRKLFRNPHSLYTSPGWFCAD